MLRLNSVKLYLSILYKKEQLYFMHLKSKNELVIVGVDLFCGVGGLTNGLISEGIDVSLGVDIDPSCEYAYEKNNKNAQFLSKDISEVKAEDLKSHFPKGAVSLLAGCAPCQPFSSYSYKNKTEKWKLLYEFSRLIEEVRPDIITMENVPTLVRFKKAPVLKDFIKRLEDLDYHVSYSIVNCPEYGIPQNRKRFVLLASQLGRIELIAPTHGKKNYKTVRQAIGKLEPLKHGETSNKDPLHKASELSPLNLKRIQQSRPGGSWKDWDEELLLECHKKDSGKTYVSVYGRMEWDKPSPTMTTQCNGIGNGRFGHPEQDRAISLREAAILQTFPKSYKFINKKKPLPTRKLATHIGNAVPVKLGKVIGKSIKKHLESL